MTVVFTVADRDRVLAGLTRAARDDQQVIAAAALGSTATHETDAWSDIDLALRVAPDAPYDGVIESWTRRMYALGAVDHHDVRAGALYRVFLMNSSLQVDLSFWQDADFAAHGSRFRLLFGEANDPRPETPSDANTTVGLAWLYALHLRSSIARRRNHQALYMLNGLRDQVVTLACIRHDLPVSQGRGVDRLPSDLLTHIGRTVPPTFAGPDLLSAFDQAVELLIAEVTFIDVPRADRLREALRNLVSSAG